MFLRSLRVHYFGKMFFTIPLGRYFFGCAFCELFLPGLFAYVADKYWLAFRLLISGCTAEPVRGNQSFAKPKCH